MSIIKFNGDHHTTTNAAQTELRTKSLAYMSVLAGRQTALRFLMLRANAARKQRSRAARALHARWVPRPLPVWGSSFLERRQ